MTQKVTRKILRATMKLSELLDQAEIDQEIILSGDTEFDFSVQYSAYNWHVYLTVTNKTEEVEEKIYLQKL